MTVKPAPESAAKGAPTSEETREYQELTALLSEIERRRMYHLAGEYEPGRSMAPTEKQAEFHALGAAARHRMLAAGNQSGKTLAGGMEITFHMTGLYPEWWTGRRFPGPVKGWVSGVTSESTRDNPQRILLGEKRDFGTGTVPREYLHGAISMSRGLPDAVDSFQTRHISGGISTCWFKSYERGREKWQGQTLHFIWFDEEPPYDIFSEGITRLNYYKGVSFITATPLLGMTKVCKLFFEPPVGDPGAAERQLLVMDLEDATFYSPEDLKTIIAQYPEHEQRARIKGLPIFGEGLVFPIPDARIAVDPFELPSHFRRIVGIDFGLNHPTAGAWLALNPDTGTVYVYDTYLHEDFNIAVHASAIKTRGDTIPVSWPHDGLKRQATAGAPDGVALRDLYVKEGVRMLPESARYNEEKGGPQSVEPIILQTWHLMEDGQFKVFNSCRDWFAAKNRWHRKDNKPVTYQDDLMKATMYALMMIRHARPNKPRPVQLTADSSYDPLA